MDTTRAKWHRIFTRQAPLARLLHCNVKSLACPIGACADGDSRTEAVMLRHWNPSGASGIYRRPWRDGSCTTILCSMLSPGLSKLEARPTCRWRNISSRVEAIRCDMPTLLNDC